MESEMSCCERIKFALSKLIMEFFGTFVFTLLYLTHVQPVMLIGLWVLTIFSWKISASQLNPAVTLAFIFRADSKKIHLTMGINMMIDQVAGAYCGALYWNFVSWGIPAMEPNVNGNLNPLVFQAMMQEIFGTFIFVLLFKIVTDERLHFSKEATINCFIIAASYIAARSIVNGATMTITANYGACLNPAVAVGITLNSILTAGQVGSTFKWFWIYWFLPFAGSAIAIIFYRFVYMKTQLMIMNDQKEHMEEKALEEVEENMEEALLAPEKTMDA